MSNSMKVPEEVMEQLAAVMVDAIVAKTRAQEAVKWITSIYGLPDDSAVTLHASLMETHGGIVPPGGAATSAGGARRSPTFASNESEEDRCV